LVVEFDRLKTTFKAKWGTFSFRCMPFGLSNVGYVIQRAMDISFKRLISQSVVVYIDYVIVFSNTRSNHLHHLRKIFKRCWKYDISLNPNKITFVVSEGNHLGNIIEKGGVKVDPECVKTITQIPYPIGKKEMQSFLEKIIFYKKIISYYE